MGLMIIVNIWCGVTENALWLGAHLADTDTLKVDYSICIGKSYKDLKYSVWLGKQ